MPYKLDAFRDLLTDTQIAALAKFKWSPQDYRYSIVSSYTCPLQDSNLVKRFLNGWKNYLKDPQTGAQEIAATRLKLQWSNLGRVFACVFGNVTEEKRLEVYAILLQEFVHSARTHHWTDKDRQTALQLFSHADVPTSEQFPVLAADEAESPMPGFVPQDGDESEVIQRLIRARRGRQAFRDSLRRRYGDRCVVTGCRLVDVLEAAHIKPYRGEADDHVENGLLLRADIHTLFDLDLLGFDPKSLIVTLHPSLKSEPHYKTFEGNPLLCKETCRPSVTALQLRFEKFHERLRRG